MAQYIITHSCGHEETISLVGPHKQRDSKIKWLEERECKECAVTLELQFVIKSYKM